MMRIVHRLVTCELNINESNIIMNKKYKEQHVANYSVQ